MKRTRTRINSGIEDIFPENPQERLDAIKNVITKSQYCKIDGQIADATTCSFIIQLYNALSPENQNKLISFQFDKIARIVYKLIK